MIHTANEYVSKHHRYLLSGVTIGLKNLDGKTGSPEDPEKGEELFSGRNGALAQAVMSSPQPMIDGCKGLWSQPGCRLSLFKL